MAAFFDSGAKLRIREFPTTFVGIVRIATMRHLVYSEYAFGRKLRIFLLGDADN